MAVASVVDALLDAIEEKDAYTKRQATSIAEAMEPDILRAVMVAARPRATDADVKRTLRQARRRELVARAVMVIGADRVAKASLVAQAQAVIDTGPSKRIGPIRKRDLEARRARRSDGNVVRLDRRGEEDDDLPTLDVVSRMTERQLVQLLERLGVEVDEESMLVQRIANAAHRLIGADRPTDTIVEQVVKTAERAVRSNVIMLTREAIRERHLAKLRTNREQPLLWIAYLDEATCPDCDERHNESAIEAVWARRGMPGSINLICWQRCRCELLPDSWFDENDPDVEGDVSVTVQTALA